MIRDRADAMTQAAGGIVSAAARPAAETRSATPLAARVPALLALFFFTCAALLPWLGGAFHTRLAIEATLLGMLAMSVDLLLGRVGLLSLGQAAFFGIGAYTAALTYLHVSQSLWVVLISVVLVTTVMAAVVGAVAIRSSGVYFALITFGVGEILSKIAANTSALGGSDGLLGLPAPTLFIGTWALPLSNDTSFLYVALLLLLVCWLLLRRLLNTPFGRVLAALHDNPARVPYLGYRPLGYKLVAFVIAANVAALGGMLYPFLRGFASPVLFGFEYSTKGVVMALVGGLGSLIGPVLGAAIVTFGEDALSDLTRHHLFAIGALFVAFVLYAPAGIAGALTHWLKGKRRKAPPDA
jgi:branched-chain amino acid transport system permease protein